jgi:hypothetical protein
MCRQSGDESALAEMYDRYTPLKISGARLAA